MPVRDAIQRDPAGKAEVAALRVAQRATGEADHRFLDDRLGRGGDVHVFDRDLRFRIAPLAAKQFLEGRVRRHLAVEIAEEGRVEPVRAVLAQVDQLIEDDIDIARLAYGASPISLYSPELTLSPQ